MNVRSSGRWVRMLASAGFVLFGGAGFGAAEVPTWQKLRAPLYAIPYHEWFYGQTDGMNAYQGIWRFDHEHNTWSRLTPFFHNCIATAASHMSGDGSYVTAFEDRLLFEGLGAWIEIDPASGRFLRRYAPGFFDGKAGWQIQGPAIGSAVGASSGLSAGVFGPPTCSRNQLAPGMSPACESIGLIPDPEGTRGLVPMVFGRDWVTGETRVLADLRGTPDAPLFDDTYPKNLSFDPGRGGFWLSGYLDRNTSLVFLPVREGVMDTAGALRQTLAPTLVGDYVRLAQYDPLTGSMFYVSQVEPTLNYRFSRLDPTTLVATKLFEGYQEAPVPITLARLPEAPPASYEQLVPIVVRAGGVGGTDWGTELWLYNPSSGAVTVNMRRVVKPDVMRTVELGPHASTRIADVMAFIGAGATGDGVTHDALVVTSPYRLGEQVVASARISTLSLDPTERAQGGTMGQGVPAVPGRTGYTNHLTQFSDSDPSAGNVEYLVGRPATYILDHREAGRFRHNMGFANDSGEPVTVSLTWGFSIGHDWPLPAGWPGEGGRVDVTVAAHSVKQVNLESLFPAAIRSWMPAQIMVDSKQPVALWFSMVDNRTGDGIHVPYSLFFMLGDESTSVAVPAMAHAPGALGTVWRSDLYVAAAEEIGHWSGSLDQIFTAFYPAWPTTSCGGAAAAGGIAKRLTGVTPSPASYEIKAGWRSVYPDVLHLYDQCASDEKLRGTVEVRSSSWMTGFGRTYTTRADGGTYGEMMPFYPPAGYPVQHFAGIELGPRFRVNLGLYNGNHEHPMTYRLTLHAGDGSTAGERTLTLAPGASLQERIEITFGKALDSFPAGSYGLTVVPLDDTANGVEGRCWAYLSMVDNVTGDPTNWW